MKVSESGVTACTDSYEYVMCCLNTHNRFTREPDENTGYNKEVGTLETKIVHTYQNIFTVGVRSNKTVKKTMKASALKAQENCANVAALISTASPIASIVAPLHHRQLHKVLWNS